MEVIGKWWVIDIFVNFTKILLPKMYDKKVNEIKNSNAGEKNDACGDDKVIIFFKAPEVLPAKKVLQLKVYLHIDGIWFRKTHGAYFN